MMLPISPKAGSTPFSANPYATPEKMYENGSYGYDVQTINPQRLMAQNFDLQRQNAMRTVGAGVQSGTATAMDALRSSGGLSAADKQALLAQGQRQRVNLGQGALAPIDQLAAQNMYDTQKFNVGQEQSALDMNQKIMNERARDMAVEKEKRAVNIYQQRLREAMLERQLDAARQIAQAQGA